MNSYDFHQKLMNSMTVNMDKYRKIHTAHMTFMNNRLNFYQWDILIEIVDFSETPLQKARKKSEFLREKVLVSAGEICSFFWGVGGGDSKYSAHMERSKILASSLVLESASSSAIQL